jgi:hypothetical protein
VVVEEALGSWALLTPQDRGPTGTLLDSKGYTRDGRFIQQPYGYGRYGPGGDIELVPPFFRVKLVFLVELPQSSEYQPESLYVSMPNGEQYELAVKDLDSDLAVPLNPEKDPTKRPLADMTAAAEDVWKHTLGKIGEPIPLGNGLSATVTNMIISDKANSGQKQSNSAVVVITDVLYKNEGGYDANVPDGSLTVLIIDNHGHYSGPNNFSTGRDGGLFDSYRSILAPGESGTGSLTPVLSHPIDQVDFVWAILLFKDTNSGGWIDSRVFHVKR